MGLRPPNLTPSMTEAQTLNSSFLMLPFKKSLTNWVFSARSCASLVPSFRSSERSAILWSSDFQTFYLMAHTN